jgi:protein SCO1/2
VIALFAAAALTVIPIHGLVLESGSDRAAIVRTDAVVDMLPPRTRRYRFVPRARFRAGTTIDALLDRTGSTLLQPIAAASFAPGLPDPGRVAPVRLGSSIPPAQLVDQNARLVELSQLFKGKTLLLSFIFTRCPDRTLCPAISGKFAYLQDRLDPRRFALAEITLDPQYDSPAVLRSYGALYRAKAGSWWLLTGTGSTIQHLLNEFKISSMRLSASNFLHDDRLFIVTPSGNVAYIVETGGWDPQSVIAQARAISGLASNPFERFKLALIADVVALCGGSELGGVVLLELSLFTLLTIGALLGMWAVARILWAKRPG